MRALKFFAATLAVLTAALGLSCQAIQRKALFYPTHDARDNGLARWVRDGEVIGYAREVPQPRNVWLLLHGNGGQAADRSYALSAFAPDDSVFILEYPGTACAPANPRARRSTPLRGRRIRCCARALRILRCVLPPNRSAVVPRPCWPEKCERRTRSCTWCPSTT